MSTDTSQNGPDLKEDWFVAGASVIGAVHVFRGLPRQDALLLVPPSGATGPVVAVADGHGASRHFRSEAGASLAVQAASRAAIRHSADLAVTAGATDVVAAVRGELAAEILASWQEAVGRHLVDNPFSSAEAAMVDDWDEIEVPYGSTLLVAMVAGRWLVCLQIGDGDIVAVTLEGRASMLVPGDPALDGVRTTSLCQSDALDHFRAGVRDVRQDPVLAVLLASDGYGNAQSADPWYPGVALDLATLLYERGPDWLGDQLPEWARRCASTEGSADDTTMAVIVSRTLARTGEQGKGPSRFRARDPR